MSNAFVYKNYSPRSKAKYGDIALLYFSSPFNLTKYVSTVKLASEVAPPNASCIISGFGTRYSGISVSVKYTNINTEYFNSD